MGRYVLRRLGWIIPVIVLVAGVTFILMHTAPGGPWDRDPGRRQVDPTTEKLLNEAFNLDQPLGQQFISYMFADVKEGKQPGIGTLNLGILGKFTIGDKSAGSFVCGALCGNLGPSYRQRGRTVQEILFGVPEGKTVLDSRFAYSVRLGLLSLFIAIVVGIPAGILSALKRNSIFDYVSMFVSTIGVSLPPFVVGLLMIILFATMLKWINVIPRSWDTISPWIVPSLVLGFGTLAFTARLTRASMLEVMRMDYIRTARAKGLPERDVIWRHMIKNAMIPVVTVLGPALAGLVVGSFIIETMFGFPGVGREYVQSISNRDYSMIMGTTLLYAVLIAVANLSVDLVYGWLDPRIKVE